MADRKANNNNRNVNNKGDNKGENNKNNNNRNVNNRGDNKGGERKNQGERLDDSKEQADLATAQKQLDKLKEKNKALTDSIIENAKMIEKCREEITRIRKSRVNYREQKAEIFAMIRKYSDKIGQIASERKVKKTAAIALKDNFQYQSSKEGIPVLVAKNLAYYDKQIANVEEYLHMESLSSGEVKMKTSQLEKERARRNNVIQFNEIWLEVEVYKQFNEQLSAQRTKYKEKLAEIEKDEKSIAALVEAQDAKIKGFTEEIEKIKEQRKQNNVEITAAAKVKDEKKTILNKKWEEWKAQQSVLRKQRAEEANAFRLQREQQNKEREEQKAKKQEASDAKKFLDETNRPYAVEIKACEFLLKYIKEIKINKQKLDAPIKKIPMDIVVKFETLSLNPPFVGKDIETLSQTLADKKKYFIELRDALQKEHQKEKNQGEKPSENIIEEAPQNGEAKEEAKEEQQVEEKQNGDDAKVEEPKEEEHKEEHKEEAKVEESKEEEHKEGEAVESN